MGWDFDAGFRRRFLRQTCKNGCRLGVGLVETHTDRQLHAEKRLQIEKRLQARKQLREEKRLRAGKRKSIGVGEANFASD